MKTANDTLPFNRLPTEYSALCRLLMPRPIRDNTDLQNVVELADTMAGHKLSADQEDYFELLCRLIEDYEKENVALPSVSGVQALQHLMEQHQMNAAALAKLLGVHRTLGGDRHDPDLCSVHGRAHRIHAGTHRSQRH